MIPTVADPQGLMVQDVNGDGRPDLIFLTQPAPAIVPQLSLAVLLAKADGRYATMTPIPAPAGMNVLCVIADVNGDGKMDVVGSNGDTPAVGDFNNDGLPDVVLGGAHHFFLAGKGDGTFAAAGQPIAPPTESGLPPALMVGDFDGDDSLAFAAVVDGFSLYVYFGKGRRHLSKPVNVANLNERNYVCRQQTWMETAWMTWWQLQRDRATDIPRHHPQRGGENVWSENRLCGRSNVFHAAGR